MIGELVPAGVVVSTACDDLPEAELLPGEAEAVAGAVPQRRREFATGRLCARRALAGLGREWVAISVGQRREPLWPPGVVGSITHCAGYRACAVAEARSVAALGIDAEPNDDLPARVTERVARGEELAMVARLAADIPSICWDRLLFSAKEAVYKAWFPLTGRWLGFGDASIAFDAEGGTFAARLLVPGPLVGERELTVLDGRWRAHEGLLATVVPLVHPPPARGGPAYRRTR